MLRAGHRIGCLAGNTPTQLSMHAAVKEQGFVMVPLPLTAPEAELQAALDQVGVDGLVVDPERRALAERIRDGRPGIVCDARGDPTDTFPGEVGPARPDAFAHIRTSGTTEPKWITIYRHQMQAHRQAAMERLECDDSSTWLDVLPPWHIGGVALIDRCMHGGGRIDLHERFDAENVSAALHGSSHVSLVPTMLHRLMDKPAPESLRCVLLGGAAATPELVAQAVDAGWPIHTTYGLTEACSQVTTALPDEVRDLPGTSGRPLRGVQVTIHAPDDSGIGEIVVEGPTVSVPGALHTGDLGRLEDGHLFVHGRADDRIVTGGENVSPERVEAVLRQHPDVEDAMVTALADPEWGQRLVAAIAGPADPEALLAWCKDRLEPHERPKEIRSMDIPRTETGKPRRAILRRAWSDD